MAEKKLWVIKTNVGKIKGPYDTESLVRLIVDGIYDGDEQAAPYPEGVWKAIPQFSDLYEKIMAEFEQKKGYSEGKQALQPNSDQVNAPKIKIDDDQRQKSQQETVISSSSRLIRTSSNTKSDTILNEPKIKKKGAYQNNLNSEVIDLLDLKKVLKSNEKYKLKAIVLGLILCLFMMGVFIVLGGSDRGEKISLIGPSQSGHPYSAESLKEKISSTWLQMQMDSATDYLNAESILVNVVERNPMSMESRALLCLVYKELWPYAKQDTHDLKVISDVARSTKQLNLSNPIGELCDSVRLITAGRYREARGVVESALELDDQFAFLPILLYFKAQLLEEDGDFANALPYYEKSGQLWEGWLAPRVARANLLRKTSSFQESARELQEVLKKNPTHRSAKINLGILLFRGFKQVEEAQTYLVSALSSNGRVHRAVEADGYLALAEILLFKGDPKSALTNANKGFILNPNNKDLKALLLRLGEKENIGNSSLAESQLMFFGNQYFRQGDFMAAQAQFKTAFETDQKNGNAAMMAAKSLWNLNQSFQAIDWLKKAIQADPKLVAAYVLQADYMSQRFDFVGANQVLAQADLQGPNNFEVFRGRALLDFRRNDFNSAIQNAMKSLKIYDADLDTFIILAKANQLLAETTSPSSKSAIEKREAAQKDALRYATKAIEIDPTSSEAHVVYAMILSQTNGVEYGINYLKEKIKKFSFSTEYRVALADIYRKEERFNQAKDLYSEVVESDPKNKKALLGIGLCYKTLGLNDRAITAFFKAAVLDPTDGESLFNAGILYLESNRTNESMEQFKRVQRMNPHYPKTDYFIGRAAFQAGSFKEALDAAEREKKKNPYLADSFILAAEIHNAQNHYNECAAEYSKAIGLRLISADIFVRAARCYRLAGSMDVAKNMLDSAYTIENGLADLYKEQGALFEMRGDTRAAIQAYLKYLGLSPNAKDRNEIEQRVQTLERGI